jgi:hypothetical protein
VEDRGISVGTWCVRDLFYASISEQSKGLREPFGRRLRSNGYESVMRTYLAKVSPAVRMVLAIPLLFIAYSVVMNAPAILRAILPEAVRSVLSVM